MVWKDAMGKEVKESDTVALHGHDLYINGVDWSHMGRYETKQSFQKNLQLKGTISIISSDLSFKEKHP